jgi:electron transport complex protein RnfC
MNRFSKGIKLPRKPKAAWMTLQPPLPRRVILPLRQYIGAVARPTVSAGDQVKVGQLIGAADGTGSLPLHATISGTVAEITEQLDHRGALTPAIVIEADGSDSWVGHGHGEVPRAPEQIMERITEAAVVIKGMHPVPLATDLLPPDQPKTHLTLTGRTVVRRIDTLIISALDPEPALLVNRYLAANHHEELATGIAALRAATGAGRTLFAVDKASPCPQLLELLEADEQETTTLIRLDGGRFPIGLTVPLLKATLGREVPLPYGHPRDVGAALYDMETTLLVGRGINRVPPVETLITVGGGALPQQGVAAVRIGTPIGELIASLGGFHAEPAKIITGGPLLGVTQYDLTVPITRDIAGLFALRRDEIELVGTYRECINCGLCVKVCPVNLVPGLLSLYCARDRFAMAEREGLFRCIECGCCDYVCPSRRPLVHFFRHAKQQLMGT